MDEKEELELRLKDMERRLVEIEGRLNNVEGSAYIDESDILYE